MQKKKEKRIAKLWRFSARVWIMSMPAAIVLILLLLTHKITILTALLLFMGVVIFTTFITFSVFQELEAFISYLKKLAQGIEIDLPHFKKGVFSSFRLADTFQSVKNRWSNQTVSDASILEHLPDPLLMINPQKIIVFMNQKAKSIFDDKCLRKKLPFKEAVFTKAIQAVLTQNASTEWFEWAYQEYVFQVRIDALPAPTRNGATAVITMNDITPFKHFREQQAAFFANASHELKTPLSIISGIIETLQTSAKNDEKVRDEFLSLMSEQTARMTNLVQELLKLARQQITQESEHDDVIDITTLIKEVILGLRVKAEKLNKKIILKKSNKLPRLIGNRLEIGQVFQNLIDNAIKYGTQGTDITVKITCEKKLDKKDALKIAVHNLGNPIAAQNLDKLFDRFYRIETPLSKSINGTGLGLSIVQQIVHEHNGTIDVVSTPRGGTTFTVYFPIE